MTDIEVRSSLRRRLVSRRARRLPSGESAAGSSGSAADSDLYASVALRICARRATGSRSGRGRSSEREERSYITQISGSRASESQSFGEYVY
jgi:hypothetical protein